MDRIAVAGPSGYENNAHTPIHDCYSQQNGFVHLQAHVATNAFDSDQTFDVLGCHPNTRLAVLNEIMSWIIGVMTRIQWILWLNGAAGAGKSAIARSVVERCLKAKIPIARFFFYRTDSTRNNIRPVVATLVHQLIQAIPTLNELIIPKIASDPLIFTKSLLTQFTYLVFNPLRELKQQLDRVPTILLLFDGVDECVDKDKQGALIRILAGFIETKDFPLIVFFGSRAETQLTMEFHNRRFAQLLLRLPLNNNYGADDDIRTFLEDSILRIRETHPLASGLGASWPSRTQIDEIIKKSSGQFIYASVVVNFLSSPCSTPSTRLEIILGLKPAGHLAPFAQMDELYRYILSQVQAIHSTLSVLALTVISPFINHIDLLAVFLNIQEDEVRGNLANLASVISINEFGYIEFLHASLPDFLTDPLRSGEYSIGTPRWPTYLSIMWYLHGYKCFSLAALNPFLSLAEPSVELHTAICSFNPDMDVVSLAAVEEYLSILRTMDFGDGKSGSVYAHQLNVWTRHLRNHNYNDTLTKIHRKHNISALLKEIKREKVWQKFYNLACNLNHSQIELERAKRRDRMWSIFRLV